MAIKCKLICMSFDGDYQTEHPRDADTFDSIEEAWEYGEDMGSRWYFYPFYFVVTASGLTIKEAPSELKFLEGKPVRTVSNLFEKFYELTKDDYELDIYEYAFALEDYHYTGQLP